jgi:hypothetical protein
LRADVQDARLRLRLRCRVKGSRALPATPRAFARASV